MKRALYAMSPASDSRAFYVYEGIAGLSSLIVIVAGILTIAHVATVQCVSCGGL